MEHVQQLERPFPWRTATVAAFAVAIGAIAVFVGLRASGLVRAHRAAAQASVNTRSTGQLDKTPLRPLRPRSHVSVLVLNGNGTSGVAGSTAAHLLARGYRSASATNAPNSDYATSLVLYRRGWEREAKRLGRDAGVRIVSPLDGRLPAGSDRDQLVIILGAS